MSIGASVHAGVATRAFLQIENEETLGLHQTLRKELIDGHAVNHLHALFVGHLAFGSDGFKTGADTREAFDHLAEVVSGDTDDFDVVESGAGGGANAAAEETDFAEIVASGEIGENEFATGIIFGDFDEADADEIETVGRVTLARDELAGSETLEFDAFFEVLNKVGRKVREHGDAAKMIFKRAAAVVGVDLSAEGFVLEHDVENIAQHFVGDDIGFRTNGGAARIEIQARHFTEEIARAEFGDRAGVGEVDAGVNGDGAVARFALAFVFFAGDEGAGEAFEETFGAPIGFYVGDGGGNGNFGFAFENIKRGGAKFAFAADDFAFAEAAFHDGAAI